MILKVNLLDFSQKKVFSANLHYSTNGQITDINPLGPKDPDLDYLLPGFIDAHVHIESSMMIPTEFARMATRHGTIASVSDPHEIANVLGIKGIEFMISNSKKTPFHIFFGAPSCVPATSFETSGSTISINDIESLFSSGDISYLSEMMNFPGVLSSDVEVIKKIELTKKYSFPIDGHAPGLEKDAAEKYIQAGISTDHECTTIEEARDKIAYGMKILIREGSAARDFTTLHPLISEFPDKVMFCSDDKHPDELFNSHINKLVIDAVALGHSIFDVLGCACINPIKHYNLPLGSLYVGDKLDAVLVNNLTEFKVRTTWLDGQKVAEAGSSLLLPIIEKPINFFNANMVTEEDLSVKAKIGTIRVIDVCEGKLFTQEKLIDSDQFITKACVKLDSEEMHSNVDSQQIILQANPSNDITQLTVLNRYKQAIPANAFVSGSGMKFGAIASTVAHDSHNIIAMGCDALSIQQAINCLIQLKGGICVVNHGAISSMALPIAGLMSLDKGEIVSENYAQLNIKAKTLGFTLTAPFMTLSFLALLVIPELKLSDKGLFDGRSFQFKELNI